MNKSSSVFSSLGTMLILSIECLFAYFYRNERRPDRWEGKKRRDHSIKHRTSKEITQKKARGRTVNLSERKRRVPCGSRQTGTSL